MRRRHVGVVAPAHEAIADIADEGAGDRRRFDPRAVAAAHFEAAGIVIEQDGQAAVIGVLAGAGKLLVPASRGG